jgi:hypothetical protein
VGFEEFLDVPSTLTLFDVPLNLRVFLLGDLEKTMDLDWEESPPIFISSEE